VARLAAVLAAGDVIVVGLATESRRAGTHRDLLGANILRNGAELALIDWDCAGPDVPWFEAVRAAIEFGRVAATVDGARPLQPDPGVSVTAPSPYTVGVRLRCIIPLDVRDPQRSIDGRAARSVGSARALGVLLAEDRLRCAL
jgi:phosphotransferase family enzyme